MLTVPSGETVTKLSVDGTDVSKGSGGANWSVSGQTVTIKKAYLATLDEDDHTVQLTFSDSQTASMTITVTDTSGD